MIRADGEILPVDAHPGLLLEPHVIREVRARDGRVTHATTPRAVRRVIARDIAEQLRPALLDVVASGTATTNGFVRRPFSRRPRSVSGQRFTKAL